MRHIMIDLETMGMKPNALVVSIGAVKFNPHLRTLGDEFYTVLNRKEQKARGATIDPGTIEWWKLQTASARSVFKAPTVPVRKAMLGLRKFIGPIDDVVIWANDPDFDLIKLQWIYDYLEIPHPWKHYRRIALKTFKCFIAGPYAKQGVAGKVAHNALKDALRQAMFVNIHYHKAPYSVL